MSLMLHCGAEEIDYDALRALQTPEPTKTHFPIQHSRLVDLARHTLAFYGHTVVSEQHGVTDDGAKYFGIMMLKSEYGGYEDAVALRNSHNKSFPVAFGFGGHVFCCDNMSFIADQVIKRRHTSKLKRDLPGLITEIVEPLADVRASQQVTFDRYRASELTDELADHAIMEMFRQGVVNVQRIAEVNKEWQEPSFEEMQGRTAWTLFNAATFALQGKVVQNPTATQTLHSIIDGVCEEVV